MKTCEGVRLLASDWLSGELPERDAPLLSEHLDGCAGCRNHVEDLLWQDRVIAELAAEARLDGMMGRIRRGIRRQSQVVVRADGSVLRKRVWRPWVAAAAALAAVAAGILLLRPSASDRSPGATVQVQEGPFRVAPVKSEGTPVVKEAPEEPSEAPKVAPESPVVRKTREISPPAPPPAPVPEKPEVRVPAPSPPKPEPVQANAAKTERPHGIIDLAPKRTVEAALRDGVAFLRKKAESVRGRPVGRNIGGGELLLWTMLHAGVPERDPVLQALLAEMLDRPLERTYAVSLQVMILEELDRVKYQHRIAQCAQFLVDNLCRNGQWSYGDPSIYVEEVATRVRPRVAASGRARTGGLRRFGGERTKPKVRTFVKIVKRRDGPRTGDNSNTQYAALGLRACHDAGILLPRDAVERARGWWEEAQRPASDKDDAGGWCYGGRNHDHPAYGSMTAGAVAAVAICDYILGRDWNRDPMVVAGLEWLGRRFSVSVNPGTPEHGGGRPEYMLHYYLYALERAGMLVGVDRIGGHDWYAEGERALLETQHLDGAWKGSGGAVRDTCFAVLFLRRATHPLIDVATGGRRDR